MTDIEFYRDRIGKIVHELDIHDLVDLYFRAEMKRVYRLLKRP